MLLTTMLNTKTALTYAIITGMLFALFAASPLSAQSDAAVDIKLQVLSWEGDIEAMVEQVDEDPVLISAEQRRVSTIYEIKTSNSLTLYHPAKDGADLGKPMASVTLKPGMKEVLLILFEKKKQYRAALLPFSRKKIPENTVTFFNLTPFSVFAKVGEETQEIKAKSRYQVPYQYVYAEHEALRTKLAVEQNGRMRLVQNGYVPIVNDGRVLFFIRENTAKSNQQSREPVTFSYAYDVMSSRSVQSSTDEDSTE